MTEPEHALELARARATAMRAAGAYAGVESAPAPDCYAGAKRDRLLDWAAIEPDLLELRSSRRMGGLLTALRRFLVRLLSPFFTAQLAYQSRFNVELLAHVRALEARVDELGAPLRSDSDSSNPTLPE